MNVKATGVHLAMVFLASNAFAAQLQAELPRPRVWGARTLRPIVRVTDVAQDERVQVTWSLSFGDRVVTEGVSEMAGSGEPAIVIELPPVRVRTSVNLQLHLWAGGQAVAVETRKIDLFPGGVLDELKDRFAQESVGLVLRGQGGETVRERVPINWRVLSTALSVKSFDGQLVVLWADAPLPGRSELAYALLERVEGGMTVVCLGGVGPIVAQEAQTAQRPPESGGSIRVLAPGHPMLANLQEGDLTGWEGDGAAVFDLPLSGNRTIVLDLPSPGDPRPVVVEERRGDGRILYCGLPVAGKLGEDPVAEIILANIMRWAHLPGPPLQRPAGCFRDDSKVREMLGTQGVHFEPYSAGAGQPLLADESLFDEANKPLLAECLERGGTVLVFGVSDGALRGLNDSLSARWERDRRTVPPQFEHSSGLPAPEVHGGFPGAHALLAGARPEDINALVQRAAQQGVLALRPVADQAHFTSLVGGGLVGKLERDGVRIVFWQPPLEGHVDEERVLGALLTNLGVRFGGLP